MKHKYAVYGNKKISIIQLIRIRRLNLSECIFCPEGKEQAEDCKIINSNLEIIGPTEKDLLKLQRKIPR